MAIARNCVRFRFVLCSQKSAVRSVDVAEHMNYSKPSVSRAMSLLKQGGFVIADIPGLIEGASEGVGLGHEFLRHIERTKMMIHVVDAAGSEGRDPIDDIYKINAELEAYNPEIASRPQVIAANKIDGIRCAKVTLPREASLAKEHNMANVIALSEYTEK